MLVFIIPIKSKEISASWEKLSKLFDRCVRSVCNQTSPNFKVVVICNQKPDTQFHHPAIEYIEVDFPAPVIERFSQNADKAKKIVTGLEYAKKFQPSHIMVVDADDCVSKHLASYVDRHPQSNGWYINRGYFYEDGKSIIYWNWRGFNQICGTSIIIRYDLYPLLLKDNPNYYDFNNAHLQGNGKLLKPLPFTGAIYTIKNGENIFMSSEKIEGIQSQNTILYFARKLLKYFPFIVNNSIRKEFGLFKLTA